MLNMTITIREPAVHSGYLLLQQHVGLCAVAQPERNTVGSKHLGLRLSSWLSLLVGYLQVKYNPISLINNVSLWQRLWSSFHSPHCLYSVLKGWRLVRHSLCSYCVGTCSWSITFAVCHAKRPLEALAFSHEHLCHLHSSCRDTAPTRCRTVWGRFDIKNIGSHV